MAIDARVGSSARYGIDWNAGTRGLLMSLGAIGLSSSLHNPWLLALGVVAFGYTLGTAFRLSRKETLAAIAGFAFRAALAVLAFVAAGAMCALLVNAPVPVLSVAGGVAMIALLAATTGMLGAALFRWLRRHVTGAPATVRSFWARAAAQVAWAKSLLALELDGLTARTGSVAGQSRPGSHTE